MLPREGSGGRGRKGLSRFPARLAAKLFTLTLVALSSACNPTTTVHVKLVDAETGLATPAMVCLTDPAGNVRLPPDGRILEEFPNRVADFYYGVIFDPDPDWIGPVREMTFIADPNLDSVPYWQEPAMFQTSGDFKIELGHGSWKIAVDHGPEYVPVFREFLTLGESEKTLLIPLERWIDMPARGWVSGDLHVHHPTLDPGHNAFLLHYAQAADVHVLNVLDMGDAVGTSFQQGGYGPSFRDCLGDYCLVPGQEDPRSTFGHVIGLNLEAMVRDAGQYDFFDVVFDGIHAQAGGLVGFAHFSSGGENLRGFPWYVTYESQDFVEFLQFRGCNAQRYYDYLDMGFRLTLGSGSDVPWASTIGEVRTYVYTDAGMDLDAWFAGLAAGRTFVTNGPMLELTVDDLLPGSEVAVSAGQAVHVSARVQSHPAIGIPQELLVMTNGGLLALVRNPARGSDINLEFDCQIERSRWIAAHAVCENGALAHTSPVYLRVDGKPWFWPPSGPALVQDQLGVIDAIDLEHTPIEDDYDQGIHDRLEHARQYYADLLTAMQD